MCGISGILNAGAGFSMRANVEKMNAALRHRGPDGEGVFVDANIALGHRRLAIIDLTTAGHQPMSDPEQRVWVVYNGEVYNYLDLKKALEGKGHVFHSQSDTEVIIHGYLEWGEGVFSKLEGMFAIGIWDASKRVLFLARDGCGVKPLFYSLDDARRLTFSSEIKGVLASGLVESEIDLQSLTDYLSFFYVPGPETILKRVRQIEPGSFMRFGIDGKSETKKYWDISEAKKQEFSGEEELYHAIREEASVGVRGALASDVPLSLLLSSGLDSSVILAELKRCGRTDIETITIRFEEESYNEGVVAARLANEFGFSNRQVSMSQEGLTDAMTKLVYHLDMLNANPCVLAEFFYFQEVAKRFKVTLMGSGNDELFAGYPTYYADRIRKNCEWIPVQVRAWIGKLCRFLPASDKKYAFEYLAKKFTSGWVYEPQKSHYWWRTIFEDEEKEKLFSDSLEGPKGFVHDAFWKYDRTLARVKDRLSFEDQMLYSDFNCFLVDNANCEVDQLSMAFSLEARPPFLSKRFASFAFGIPYADKLRNGTTKLCLRRAYEDLLPPYIIKRKKQGLVAPVHRIVGDEEFTNDHLLTTRMKQYFDSDYIQLLLKEQAARRHNHSYRLYALLTFAIWESLFIGRQS